MVDYKARIAQCLLNCFGDYKNIIQENGKTLLAKSIRLLVSMAFHLLRFLFWKHGKLYLNNKLRFRNNIDFKEWMLVPDWQWEKH